MKRLILAFAALTLILGVGKFAYDPASARRTSRNPILQLNPHATPGLTPSSTPTANPWPRTSSN